MEDKELLKCDVKDLETAYDYIHTAMNFLSDINEFSDNEYEILNTIAEHINGLKIQKEIEIEKEAEL